jgi:hypothetical protein
VAANSRSAASGRDGSIGCHSRHGGYWPRSRASASQQARDPAAALLRRAHHLIQHLIMLARYIGRKKRQPSRRILRLNRPVHLQRERVGHLVQRPSRHRYIAVRPDPCVPNFLGQPGEHSLDPLSLQPRQLMVELISQRCQRPAARSADDDFPHQVTSQPVRQDSTPHP